MSESITAPYEYTTRQAKTRALFFRRATICALYALWSVLLLWLGAELGYFLPALLLCPLTVILLVLFTWRLTQVEYEFSFFDGHLTVSRVLGGRSRRELCSLKLRAIERLLPCADEEAAARIAAFDAERTVFAGSDEASPHLFAALFKDDENRSAILYFEPTLRALQLIRAVNFTAVARAHDAHALPSE